MNCSEMLLNLMLCIALEVHISSASVWHTV